MCKVSDHYATDPAYEWRWRCFRCKTDLGPMVGKHWATCPTCGCKSAYCEKVEAEQ